MKLFLPALFALSFMSCPLQPTPAPTPTPSAPLPASTLLVTHDGQFWRDGVPIRLQGVGGVCCSEAPDSRGPNPAKAMGWPLVTPEVVREIAAARGNFVHIRLGPFIKASEGAGYSGYAETADCRPSADGTVLLCKYNLDVFEPAFWARVREIVQTAAPLGVYVEVDLWDGWMQRNAEEVSPLVPERNAQGESLIGCEPLRAAPAPRVKAWVMKAVLETGEFENVLYQLGNENFVCGVQPIYESGLIEAIRYVESINKFPRHLIGTNAQRADMEAAADYAERHASEAQDPESYPVSVNEYTVDSLSPEQFQIEMEAAVRRRTSFMLWMGQQTDVEWARSLSYMKASMEGHGKEIPESCPAWVKLKAGVFSIMAPDHATFLDTPVPDGFLRLDSTPFFDDGKGGWGKCNIEGDVCNARRCEDPRGLEWRQLEGPLVTWSVSNPGPLTGYSVNVGGIARRGTVPLTRGTYVFEGCPLPDAHDGEIPSKPLSVGAGCAKVRFTVKEAA
jgi:hypothetical protein